jgi:hypothetical protein
VYALVYLSLRKSRLGIQMRRSSIGLVEPSQETSDELAKGFFHNR